MNTLYLNQSVPDHPGELVGSSFFASNYSVEIGWRNPTFTFTPPGPIITIVYYDKISGPIFLALFV